jgi:hypothetical protein
MLQSSYLALHDAGTPRLTYKCPRQAGQRGKKQKGNVPLFADLGRDRTCNLLIRSQTPCHWATRPLT